MTPPNPLRWFAALGLAGLLAHGPAGCAGDAADSTPDAAEAAPDGDTTPVAKPDQPNEDTEPDGDPIPTEAAKALVASVASAPEPASSGLWLELEPKGGDIIEARVMGTLDDTFGVAFRLQYDSRSLELLSSQTPDVLGGGNSKGGYMAIPRGPGLLLYGGARFVDDTQQGGPQYSGTDITEAALLVAKFRAIAPGEAAIGFAPQGREVRSATYEITEVAWGEPAVVGITEVEGVSGDAK
jgi:hypothetical protein